MDDIRFGIAVRTARIQRGWRQRDLALLVGVSDAVISRVERGHVDGVTVGALRRIAAALEISVELLPRSRSANVDRLVHARHAELAESVIRWLGRFDGWIVRPEVSFSRFGERGVIDLLLWHSGRHALLVIELKTAIIDVGELLGTLDRKVRNAGEVARGLGWDPITIGCVLIVAEGATNRRRVRAHAATFTASMPHRVMYLRRWLSDLSPSFGRSHSLQIDAQGKLSSVSTTASASPCPAAVLEPRVGARPSTKPDARPPLTLPMRPDRGPRQTETPSNQPGASI
jgi:transcriptional regulator with XRE-family HTH domain